jgi:all-trans-retinol 13,14-reductase
MAVKSSAHDIADDVRLTLLVAGLVAAWVLFHALRRPAPPGNPPTAQHKTGFTAKRAEAFGRLDAIVIGSSPGGLGAAAMLARRGKKVLVLEANEALGGGLHTWEDHGCPFETGFHYIGEMHCEASPLRRIIDYVAPGVSWAAMADCPHAPGIYDEVTIGGDRPICLKLRPGEGAWTAELIRAFPGEEKAVRRFLKLCKQSAGVFLPDIIWRSISSPTLSRWLRRLMTAAQRPFQSRTADEVLAPLTSNRQLVGALSYIMVSCCGVGPSQAAFAALAGVTCHFLQGGAYPIGGAPSLVAALLHTIQAFGGGAFVCAAVESIVLDARGRAIGVRMKRNGVELRAPVVISTVGVKMTLEQLIPHPAPTSLPGVRAAQV